jgi:hypothetical protein
MTDDGQTLVVSAQGVGYTMPFATNTLATIPLTGPQTFGRVQYLDGRILTNEPGTRRFWYSDPFAPATWPALNFYEAEARADLLLTLLIDHRELYLFGTQSIEVWHPTGDSLNPYMRASSTFIEQGIAAPWACVAMQNTVYFLGGSPRGEGPVWRLEGFAPVRISTHAVESSLSHVTDLSGTEAYTARHGGHSWYFLHVPGHDTTWAYDVATQGWTELADLTAEGTLTAWRAGTHCLAFGDHLWGDRTTGHLYRWRPDWYTHGTDPLYRERISPHIRNDQQPVVYHLFELLLETGVGLDGLALPGTHEQAGFDPPDGGAQPPGADPQVMLSWSDDGGHSWSHPLWRSAGRIGERTRLVRWRRLGRAKSQRAFKVVVTDPVFTAILGARLEVS